jgi:hypothetical protein
MDEPYLYSYYQSIGTSKIRSSICEQYKFVVIILVSKHASTVTSSVTLWFHVFVEALQIQNTKINASTIYTCAVV